MKPMHETSQGQLLFAILQQAIKDAGTKKKPTTRSERERRKCRRWIMSEGTSFSEACDLLGIDAGVIKQGLRQTTKWANEY